MLFRCNYVYYGISFSDTSFLFSFLVIEFGNDFFLSRKVLLISPDKIRDGDIIEVLLWCRCECPKKYKKNRVVYKRHVPNCSLVKPLTLWRGDLPLKSSF